MGNWKCFAEISGDSGIAINENFTLNELLSRKTDAPSLSSSQQLRQFVGFSQTGILHKNQGPAWH
mgnify:CR=1 FL=1